MRAFGRRAVPVFIATLEDSFVAHSRWYHPCPGARNGYPAPTDLPRFLEDLPFERAVLVPCGDHWVRAVASLDSRLRDRFPSSVADPVVIDTLMDKGRLAGELDRLGLPHPATILINSSDDFTELPEEGFANAILKPRDSLRFTRRFGTKAFRVRNKPEALRRYADLEKEGHTIVLQEFIPGAVSDHYFIDGFVDSQGRIRARFARQRLRIWPPDFGLSSYLVSVPLQAVAAASETIDRLFSSIRYRGVFSAEFVRDPRDGSFRLLEVNVRPYWHIEFAAQCGVDLSLMAYIDALGLPVESVATYAVGLRCSELFLDLPAVLGLLKKGEIRVHSWLFSYLRAEPVVFAWDDPGPGLQRVRDFLEVYFLGPHRRRTSEANQVAA